MVVTCQSAPPGRLFYCETERDRSTAEALKHEKFLFLSKAGAYGSAQNPTALLAENVEGLVSSEHAKWTSVQEQTAAAKTQAATGR